MPAGAKDLVKRNRELEKLLEVAERKSDVLTNLLKEASAEYEQTLERTRISEANFRAIFENAPEAIYIIDSESHDILDCNPFVLKWLGYTRREMLRLKVEDILEPGALRVRENIQTAMKSGLVYISERRFRKKNGTVADAEVTGTPVEFQGRPCFVALVRDITERKQFEELSRYKELFESVSDLVFINDRKGRFLEVNDVACDSLGYSRRQFMSMTIREVTWPEHIPVLEEMSRKIQENETFQFEVDLVTRSGVSVPFEFQGRLILFQNELAFLSVARNLSVRKKLQEALIRNERLSAVGEMASGVAHNFNNLLQMIMAGAEVSLAKLDAGRIRECREALRNILDASHRGADVVRRIKDFTLIGDDRDAGKVFDLSDLLDEAVALTKPLWKPPSAPQKFRLNVFRNGDAHIKGGSSEIYEVLVNLIKNALEAMPGGGVLSLSTHNRNDHVFLVVADTGHGIAEEHFQRIFEPFFTTKGSQSSGLGLSSCYGIVKKHQGEIHVNSVPGSGTEFTVAFPQATPECTEILDEDGIEQGRPIRFLMIDDEVNILRTMEMFFEDTDIRVSTAQTGEEGLKAVQTETFDVVLCDLSMDDMNGLEVGKAIREFYEHGSRPKIPFLLYTGLESRLDAGKLEASGIDQVINKPTACDDLRKIIRRVVSACR